MASLSEAYGCTFSETPFEIIDENFNIEEKPLQLRQQQEVPHSVEHVEKNNYHQKCNALQIHMLSCPSCKEAHDQKEMTNLLLLVVIGLLLFIIIEKRMK